MELKNTSSHLKTKAEEFNIVDEYFRIGKSQNGIDEHEFSPKTHCQYFFGYLSTKNKEEAVPETCFDCPNLLNAMLKELRQPIKKAMEEHLRSKIH